LGVVDTQFEPVLDSLVVTLKMMSKFRDYDYDVNLEKLLQRER
jgi:hypothetical protein